MINHLNYDVFPEKGIFGLPVIIGLPLVLFVVGMIVAVLIDTFIISGTNAFCVVSDSVTIPEEASYLKFPAISVPTIVGTENATSSAS